MSDPDNSLPPPPPPTPSARQQWAWAKSASGAIAILCDGEEVFVAEDFIAALKWLRAHLKSGELEA